MDEDDIKTLKEERLQVTMRSRTALEDIENKTIAEKRAMTTDERNILNGYDKDLNILDDKIEIAERKLKNDNDMRSDQPASGEEQPHKPETRSSDDEIHERAFEKYLSNSKNITDEELRAMNAGSDEDGGYITTPQTFVKKLIKKLETVSFLRQYATVIPILHGDSLGVPTLEDDGDDAKWTAELEVTKASEGIKLGKRELKTNQLVRLVLLSRKLSRISALPIESLIIKILAKKISAAENYSFFVGTGVGEPLGVCHKDAGIKILKGAADYDFFIDVQEELDEAYNPMWIFNKEIVKDIRKLKDGNGQYIHHPATEPGAPDKILGLPYIRNKHIPSTDIGVYGDFSYYWILDSLNLQIEKILELFKLKNMIGFFAIKETDGMPVSKEAFRIMRKQG